MNFIANTRRGCDIHLPTRAQSHVFWWLWLKTSMRIFAVSFIYERDNYCCGRCRWRNIPLKVSIFSHVSLLTPPANRPRPTIKKAHKLPFRHRNNSACACRRIPIFQFHTPSLLFAARIGREIFHSSIQLNPNECINPRRWRTIDGAKLGVPYCEPSKQKHKWKLRNILSFICAVILRTMTVWWQREKNNKPILAHKFRCSALPSLGWWWRHRPLVLLKWIELFTINCTCSWEHTQKNIWKIRSKTFRHLEWSKFEGNFFFFFANAANVLRILWLSEPKSRRCDVNIIFSR